MSQIEADVIRIHTLSSTLSGILKSKQLGFESDGDHRIMFKNPSGQYLHWTPDEYFVVSSGNITGSGTVNYLTKWSSASTIIDSSLFDNGTSVGINTSTPSSAYRLDCNGNANFSADVNTGSGFQVNNTGLSGYALLGDGTRYVPGLVLTPSSSIDDLSDVDTSGVTKDYVLKWNGTNWVPAVYNASFVFSIASFTSTLGSTTKLIGTGVWLNVGGTSFSATYNNGPATNAYLSRSGWTNLTMSGVGYIGPTANTQSVDYPSVGSTQSFTLNATDGLVNPTSTLTYYFYNYRFWGVSTDTTYDESDVEGLANSELSNSRAKTFTVTAGTGEYIVYSYPSRLGSATFTVGGFEGGFQPPETVSITNPSGYVEDYYVYRSTNSGLGTTTVVVT